MNKVSNLGNFTVAVKAVNTTTDPITNVTRSFYNLTIISEDGLLGDVINVSEDTYNDVKRGSLYILQQFSRTVNYIKDGAPKEQVFKETILTLVE